MSESHSSPSTGLGCLGWLLLGLVLKAAFWLMVVLGYVPYDFYMVFIYFGDRVGIIEQLHAQKFLSNAHYLIFPYKLNHRRFEDFLSETMYSAIGGSSVPELLPLLTEFYDEINYVVATPRPEDTAEHWRISAWPKSYGRRGKLSFYLDESGVIRSMDNGGLPGTVELPDTKRFFNERRFKLHVAVLKGDLEGVRKFSQSPENLELWDHKGNSAVCLAALANKQEAFRILVAAGAKTDTLYQYGNDFGWGPQSVPQTILHEAMTSGRAWVLDEYLAAGRPINDLDRKRRTPLHLAASRPSPDSLALVQKLLAAGAVLEAFDEDRRTPILCAAEVGHPETFRYLAEQGATLIGPDLTVLHSAAANAASPQMVEEALRALGPMAKGVANSSGRYGTPLHAALSRNNPSVVPLLLQAGADPNYVGGDEVTSPLHMACRSGDANLVALLLDAGARTDAYDGAGRFPHHLLIMAYDEEHEAGYMRSLDLLIEDGADLSVPTKYEEEFSCMGLVQRKHINTKFARYLQEAVEKHGRN